jgi:hypothetical protein
MKFGFAVVLFTLLFAPVMLMHAQDDAACPVGVPPRLEVGGEGRRLWDDVNNVRAQPTLSAARVGTLNAGTLFSVLAGPQCSDGYAWWHITFESASGTITGWTAEGDPVSGEYWLAPRGDIVTELSEDGLELVFVELEDGTLEREGCLTPPNDYERISIGAAQFNARTLAMLDHANLLHWSRGGTVNFRQAITQGGYTGGLLAASFGTHDAGGAVDLSVMQGGVVLTDEIPLMIDSLRVAGFAAWLRRPDQLYDGSIIHIHAIAVGDEELSPAARDQIDGDYGYLRGYNGLPPEWGGPAFDEHGGPVICAWMRDMGFDDLRED